MDFFLYQKRLALAMPDLKSHRQTDDEVERKGVCNNLG